MLTNMKYKVGIVGKDEIRQVRLSKSEARNPNAERTPKPEQSTNRGRLSHRHWALHEAKTRKSPGCWGNRVSRGWVENFGPESAETYLQIPGGIRAAASAEYDWTIGPGLIERIMRVFLLNSKTGLYFQSQDSWTSDPSQAKD